MRLQQISDKMADSTTLLLEFLKKSRKKDRLGKKKEKKRREEERRQLEEGRRSRDFNFESWKKLILMLKETPRPHQNGVASSLAVKVELFKFDRENNHTFTLWIKRFEEVVGQQESLMSKTEKGRFFVSKLDVYSYEGLADSILPLQPSQLNLK